MVNKLAASELVLNPDGSVYTSPTYKGSNFAASVTASGVNQSSTLKVEQMKNGKVVKTSTAQGTNLVSSIAD